MCSNQFGCSIVMSIQMQYPRCLLSTFFALLATTNETTSNRRSYTNKHQPFNTFVHASKHEQRYIAKTERHFQNRKGLYYSPGRHFENSVRSICVFLFVLACYSLEWFATNARSWIWNDWVTHSCRALFAKSNKCFPIKTIPANTLCVQGCGNNQTHLKYSILFVVLFVFQYITMCLL